MIFFKFRNDRCFTNRGSVFYECGKKTEVYWYLFIDVSNKTSLKKESLISPMTVSCYHVTYAFQSESTLYSCLDVKQLLVRNRRDI